jgi:anti-anti-sigma factor
MHPVRPPTQHPTKSGQSLALTVTTHNRHVLAHATGQLDRYTGTLFAAFIEHEIHRGYLHISVDLDHVHSIDEDGLATLRQADESLRALGGRLDLRETHPSHPAVHEIHSSRLTAAWAKPHRRHLRLLPPIDP